MKQIAAVLMAAAVLGSAPAAAQEPPCGSLANAYGPFDYRKERGRALGIVDAYHFNDDVRNLRRGQSGRIGEDLDYVLRASPNHHPALATISEWGVKLGTREPPGLKRSIDCYFERASRFEPDDLLVRLLYANFLRRMNLKAEALQVLEPIEHLSDLQAFTHQNLGLLLLDLGEPERALMHAWKSQELGWVRPGLKERLEAAGLWRDPPPAGAPATAASATSAASAVPAASAAPPPSGAPSAPR